MRFEVSLVSLKVTPGIRLFIYTLRTIAHSSQQFTLENWYISGGGSKLHSLRFQICTTDICAVENMLHWAVKKIFFLNREQIPQCDSRTCAPVTTLLKSYLPTVVADNCKQAKLLLVKYDAGHPPILSGSHWCVKCVRVCVYCNRNVSDLESRWKTSQQTRDSCCSRLSPARIH